MKSFNEVASPNVKPHRPDPANTDFKPYEYKKESRRVDPIISRIVPFLVVKYPDMLDTNPVLRRPEDLAQVYKNIPLQIG